MGACKSKIKGGGASLSVNSASINHLEAKIKKLNNMKINGQMNVKLS